MSYNFKTVMGSSSYKPWSKWSPGDYLIGIYQSTSEDNYGKPNYRVEVVEAKFEEGDEPKAGSIFTFNSNGSLQKAMEEVKENDIIKVIYLGEETLSKGRYAGKKFHSLQVLVADKKSQAQAPTTSAYDLI